MLCLVLVVETELGHYLIVEFVEIEMNDNDHELNAVTAIHYLPLHHHIVSMTADYNIMTYRLKKKKNVDTDGGRVLWLHRHLIGCNDDVLDMAVLNPPNESRDNSSDDDDNIGNSHCGLKFAVVTNSAQVRLMDGNSFECVSLNGHSDIVLAIDATPDG